MSNLYYILLLKLHCLYHSCYSHRPAHIYKQMGLISDIQIQACDRHRYCAGLHTEILQYLVWSSYVIKKICFL